MALAIVTLLVLRADQYAQRRLTLAGLAVAGALVLLSRSLTAVVTALLLVGLLRFYRMLNRSLGAATLTAIGFLLLTGIPAIWIASEADTILRAAGRDITLSGRTVLWGFVLESIRQQPWIGYGFSAFWTEANSAATFIITEIRWSTPHAHNGFLDLLLELGAVGLTIFLIGFGVALARAGRAVRTSEGLTALWPVAYLTFLFLYNLTESASVKQGSMYWVLYVATFCSATWTPYRLHDRAERPRFTPGGVVSLGVRTRMRRKWVGDDRSWRQGSG
jgi:O-antigen ligase